MDMKMHSNLMSSKAHLQPSFSWKEQRDIKERNMEGKALNGRKAPCFCRLSFFSMVEQAGKHEWNCEREEYK